MTPRGTLSWVAVARPWGVEDLSEEGTGAEMRTQHCSTMHKGGIKDFEAEGVLAEAGARALDLVRTNEAPLQ